MVLLTPKWENEHARIKGKTGEEVPDTFFETALRVTKNYQTICDGLILSAHDLSEGGLGVALSEMSFSEVGGVSIDLDKLPTEDLGNARCSLKLHHGYLLNAILII